MASDAADRHDARQAATSNVRSSDVGPHTTWGRRRSGDPALSCCGRAIRVEGSRQTWMAKITAEDARLPKEHASRVEAGRERERNEEQARGYRARHVEGTGKSAGELSPVVRTPDLSVRTTEGKLKGSRWS
jgi:hypothetical protein